MLQGKIRPRLRGFESLSLHHLLIIKTIGLTTGGFLFTLFGLCHENV
jgi:hypothetical protein